MNRVGIPFVTKLSIGLLSIVSIAWSSSLGAPQETRLTVDAASSGRTFEGIGALSAGASSRLLRDYPESLRNDILDILFKPKYAASLQHLKVEIGGDINSTDGTEPSHARNREEFNHPKPEYFHRGYEWMLMNEAKKRNPGIVLDVLQWGAPNWIGDQQPGLSKPERDRFFSYDNANFIASFIMGAKEYHGLTIDYCGIWNETPYDIAWIKKLRLTLNAANLNLVRIVAADQTPDIAPEWKIADDILADPELAYAVHTIGAHYASSTAWKFALKEAYASTDEARKTGKSLWASEDGPWRDDWEGGTGVGEDLQSQLCRRENDEDHHLEPHHIVLRQSPHSRFGAYESEFSVVGLLRNTAGHLGHCTDNTVRSAWLEVSSAGSKK